MKIKALFKQLLPMYVPVTTWDFTKESEILITGYLENLWFLMILGGTKLINSLEFT